MGIQTVDYTAVIQDLEQRRAEMNARFDAAIAAMRHVLAIQTPNSQAGVATTAQLIPLTHQLPYRKMSMLQAAIAHIRSVGHGVPNVELAKAVENGGFPHNSKNFPNTLNSVLWRRAKTIGDVRKSAQGWEIVPLAGLQMNP